MHIGANVNPAGPEWAEVCMTLMPMRATMTVRCQTCRGSVVFRLLSLLISPRRTLERDRLERELELRGAFARGRRVRRGRIGT